MNTIRLYHGTSARALPFIAEHGIMPRGKDGTRNNWKHTVGSNAKCVYLTDSYAFYFAWCAVSMDDKEDLALLEVEVPAERLQADEDAIEQATRGRDNLPADWDMKRRTIYYRSRAHQYRAAASLELLGTCSHRGTIPVSDVRRVVLIDHEQCMRLIFSGFDPVISLMNYRILGEHYRASVQWMFGDAPAFRTYGSGSEIARDGITVYDSISDALNRPVKETANG